MIDLNTIWFLLITALFAGYAVLDGFDLGVGVLHLGARSDTERRLGMNAIGPVWDGNEVWLITGGGSLFAAFPIVYATAFSSFYIPLMLVLVALIFRAVSLEFRGQVDSPGWARLWDWSFGLGSLVTAILFGVAVGNILRGIPIDEGGMFTGTFVGLLNPYSILIGLLSLVTFTMHGALYMTVKTDGELRQRMARRASGAWIAFIALYLFSIIYTLFEASHLFDGLPGNALFWVLLILLPAAVVYMPVALKAGRYFRAFLSSSLIILCMTGFAALGLYPRLVPSSIDLANSLTIYNASSTPKTLTVMLIIALIGMPLVIGYTVYIYRVFKGKAEPGYGEH